MILTHQISPNFCSRFGNFYLSLHYNIENVRVIARRTLREYWEKHKDCEQQLKAWYQEAERANWTSPNDIKQDYPNASIIEDNRMVFNIKGNHYRLIVRINYDYGIVWIRFVGTHAKYDKIDTTKV